ncbi:MAG: site-specific integrase [Nibricoccus sp.]
MIQYVFKQSRRKAGRRILSRSYSGRYALQAGDRPVTVSLYTSNKKVAEKRLRDLVTAKQCEAEGIVQPEAIRFAAAASLVSLVSEYKADLNGRGLAAAHVVESVRRIERVIGETGWARLADVSPTSFVAWRAKLTCAAKTKKEFQVSVNAFFNWLVRLGRLAVNPLRGVDMVDTRGKAVRVSRAFTQAELAKLCEVAPAYRRLVYLFLAYTGARTNEARALLWDDVNLGDAPCVVFRASTTKDKDKRTVPLHPELAKLLCCEAEVTRWRRDLGVFARFPSDDALQADMARAGIERRDASGRVLHFHAFRKTFQTWGAQSGVGQRAAQEMLGHSDPSLTANVYTDVAALGLHAEVAKLPWVLAPEVHTAARTDCVSSCAQGPFRAVLTQLVELAQKAISEGDNTVFGLPKLAARHGFEP